MLGPPSRHVPRDGSAGPLVAEFPHHPAVDALRGVALLARRAQVRLERRVDPARVGVDRRMRPPRPSRGGRRHVVHVGALRHRVAADAQPPRDLRPRHSPCVHLAYILLRVKRHGHLPFPFRAGSRQSSPPGANMDRAVPLAPGARPVRTVISFRCLRCSVRDAYSAHFLLHIYTEKPKSVVRRARRFPTRSLHDIHDTATHPAPSAVDRWHCHNPPCVLRAISGTATDCPQGYSLITLLELAERQSDGSHNPDYAHHDAREHPRRHVRTQ